MDPLVLSLQGSVAKRQQFSCPLGTATLSLKFENVVPGRWICSFYTVAKYRFYRSSIDEQHSYVRVLFDNSLTMQRFFYLYHT